MERTEAFDTFIDPAYERNEIWRLLQGLITGTCVFVVLAFVILGAGNGLLGLYDVDALIDVLSKGVEPAAMFLILLSFFALMYATFAAAAWHHRDPGTLFGPRRIVVADFLRMGLLSIVVLLGVGAGMHYVIQDTLTLQHPVSKWALMMLWAVPLLFVQISAEEVFFRGYLLQQLAARFNSPVIWAVFPSLLFGALHYDPSLDASLALMGVASATIFGLLAVDLTRMTGSLGAAMGYHFVNNFVAMLLVGFEGRLSGLALYLSGFTFDDVEVLRILVAVDLAILFFVWAVARKLFQR